MWQFRIGYLFLCAGIVAVACVGWLADPPGLAIIISGISCYLLTGASVASAIYCRGNVQAFWIGAAVPLLFESFSMSLVFADPFTLTWNQLIYFLTLDAESWGVLATNYYSATPNSDIDTLLLNQLHGFHKKVIFAGGISFLSGLLSAAVRWWVVPKGTTDIPVDIPAR